MKKIPLLLLLSISLKTISSSGYLDEWNDDQSCEWMNNQSPYTRIDDDKVNMKSYYCVDGSFNKVDKAPIINSSIIVNKLKSINKILRGKKPIYSTNGGTQIKIEPLDEEKSIILKKLF
ncbi:hypothetical protein OAN88_02820 [Candidatus Thioglobus sp.]|nr:hypothetical protein [Candidatus Thioglobus sp.]